MKQIKPGIYEERKGKKKLLLTKNLVPGKQVYGERLVREKGVEFREWNPMKSKLGAAIMKGIKEIGIKPGSIVLYLGAASGTTPSHVSDIVGKQGFVFAIDFAPRVLRDLVFVCEDRKNMTPMMEDANHPEKYVKKIAQPVDVIFQDIAQRNQAEIFLKNLRFLKKGGIGLIAVKARSIDVTKAPGQVFDETKKKLEGKVKILEYKRLEPYEKDHCIFVVKR